MAGTPQGVSSSALGIIANQAADKIVAALDRNTAAHLTVAAEILAYSVARATRPSLTQDEVKQEILTLFNRFLTP